MGNTVVLRREGPWLVFEPTPPKDIARAIYNELYIPGEDDVERGFAPYFKGKIWMGSLKKTIEILQGYGLEVDVQPHAPFSKRFTWSHNINYWPTQEAAVMSMVESQSGIMTAATGSGKTIIASGLICEMGQPTLVLTYQSIAVRAFHKSLKKFTNIPRIGQYGDGVTKMGDVIVTTINSAIQAVRDPDSEFGDWIRNTCRMVIIDEAHHSVSDGTLECIAQVRHLDHLYAMTATARRADSRHSWLKAIFGEPIHAISYRDNLEAGTQVPITVTALYVPEKKYGLSQKIAESYSKGYGPSRKMQRESYTKVFNDYVIKGATGRNEIIVDQAQLLVGKGKTVAISVTSIPQAETLHELCVNKGLSTLVLVETGKHKLGKADRNAALERFENREYDVLISTVIDEAVDMPSLDAVILAGAGKSSVKAEQRIRCSRGCKQLPNGIKYNKKRGFVVLLQDNCDFLRKHYEVQRKTIHKLVVQHNSNRFYEQNEDGTWNEL